MFLIITTGLLDKLMLVANSQIVPGTNRRELKPVPGFAIRHQHQFEDELRKGLPHAMRNELK